MSEPLTDQGKPDAVLVYDHIGGDVRWSTLEAEHRRLLRENAAMRRWMEDLRGQVRDGDGWVVKTSLFKSVDAALSRLATDDEQAGA